MDTESEPKDIALQAIANLANFSAMLINLNSSNRAFIATEMVDFYLQLQNILQPQLSLEVGANQAEFSQSIRKLMPKVTVKAFEASPAIFADRSAKFDYMSHNILYYNLAVSNINGKASFNAIMDESGSRPVLKESTSGEGSLLKRMVKNVKEKECLVDAVTGDAIIAESETGFNNVCLWIDVEGASKEVLQGFQKSFEAGIVSSVFIEVESWRKWNAQWLDHDVVKFLLKYGYVPILRDAEYAKQYNTVFIRHDLLSVNVVELLSIFYQKLRVRSYLESSYLDIWNSFQLRLGKIFSINDQFFSFSTAYNRFYQVINFNNSGLPINYKVVIRDCTYFEFNFSSEFMTKSANCVIISPLIEAEGIIKKTILKSFVFLDLHSASVIKDKSSFFAIRVPFSIHSADIYSQILFVFMRATLPFVRHKELAAS